MERLSQEKPKGLSRSGVRLWAMLFLTAGVIGRSILQNRLLGIGQVSGQGLLDLLSSSENAMATATAALILQALETCGLPLFALLLVEGFVHTHSGRRYFLRLLILAAASEIPYNLAFGGKWLDLSSRNPAFALVVGIVMLYLFRQYSEKTAAHRIVKAVVVVFAIFWVEMLGIGHGTPMVILIGLIWLCRKRHQFRSLVAACGAMLCTLISPFYLVSAMGCVALHLYNGEKGQENRVANYLVYPIILLATGLISLYVM